MSRQLYPPLEWIAAGSDALANAAAVPDSAADSGADAVAEQVVLQDPAYAKASLQMPEFLRTMVQRRVLSQSVHTDTAPAVGQIRAVRVMGRQCGVLLGSHWGQQCWSGWMVARELDYAGDRDLVLEAGSAPLAPEAALVQTWNPLRCRIGNEAPLWGKLAPALLATVFELADSDSADDTFVAPRPGLIGLRGLQSGATVLTGTPLGDDADPRHAYQDLYRTWAMSLRTQADGLLVPPTPVAAKRGLVDWLQDFFVRPAWAVVAVVLIASQGVWIAISTPSGSDSGAAVYRGADASRLQPCGTRLRVVFKPGVSYADMVVDIRRIEGSIVDGPSELGEVWISLHTDMQAQQAIHILRLSKFVASADLNASPERECK